MALHQVFRKHINSILLFSTWILSVVLYILLLYLADSNRLHDNIVFRSTLIPIALIGLGSFVAWTGMFVIGISNRALKLYNKLNFAIEDGALILVFCIFALLGYLYGKNEQLERIRLLEKELKNAYQEIQFLQKQVNRPTTPTPTPRPLRSQRTAPIAPEPTVSSRQSDEPEEWGVAKQIGEHTWTMKIQMDSTMATPREIFDALNEYRYKKRREKLQWDDKLAEYAHSRAQFFTSNGKLDEHAGFSEYVKSIDHVKKLGFWSVGENSSFGYRMNGLHLIEWIYAGDPPHDNNQLMTEWTHVGIGVDGHQTNLIFGGNKM